jgi:hypothetical protein
MDASTRKSFVLEASQTDLDTKTSPYRHARARRHRTHGGRRAPTHHLNTL